MKNPTTPGVSACPVASNPQPHPLNAAHFKLESFIKFCIVNNLKGMAAINSAANQHGIALTYWSIIRKINQYQSSGIEGLKRKEYKSKGEPRSFSPEALRIMQSKFVESQVMVLAYEDTHKYFRAIAESFIDTSTGEEFQIKGSLNLSLSEGEGSPGNIVAFTPASFKEGIYIIQNSKFSIHNSNEVRVGSYKSACRFLSHIKINNADTLHYHKYGLHDYRLRRQHTMKLNYSNLAPCSLLVGDGKQLDILVISDDWRRVHRPYLFGWIDAATRRYCWWLGLSETSENIANSLSAAIQSWGVPDEIKTDNGSAYISGRLKEMCRFFGIKQHFAIARLARSKMIESFHNIIDNMLKSQIGYTGNRYQAMPEDTKNRLKLVAGEQRDIKRLEKFIKEQDEFCLTLPMEPEAKLRRSKNRFMHIGELTELLTGTFEQYHNRLHGGLQTDKLGKQVYNINCKDELINNMGEEINNPYGRYKMYLSAGFKPVTADPGIVALYTTDFELRTIQIKTGINFSGAEFYHPQLARFAGEHVIIRFSSRSAKSVYVFHSVQLQEINHRKHLTAEIMNGLKFICIAERQELIDYNDPAFKEKLILQREEERRIRNTNGASPLRGEDGVGSNIVEMTGSEDTVHHIRQAEEEIKIKKSKNKYSDVNHWD